LFQSEGEERSEAFFHFALPTINCPKASSDLAAAFALATVLALAALVAGLTAALAFAAIQAFAIVLGHLAVAGRSGGFA
jgi:hypothetical protein